MYKYVNSYDIQFKLSELIEPNDIQMMMFEKAKELINFPSDIDVRFYIAKGSHITNRFSGMACKLSSFPGYSIPRSTPYAVVVSQGIFRENESYIMYLLTHELKHCTGNNGLFRPHDDVLTDIGWEALGKENMDIGFFREEWKWIGCCDDLLFMFKNVDGIEGYI